MFPGAKLRELEWALKGVCEKGVCVCETIEGARRYISLGLCRRQ